MKRDKLTRTLENEIEAVQMVPRRAMRMCFVYVLYVNAVSLSILLS